MNSIKIKNTGIPSGVLEIANQLPSPDEVDSANDSAPIILQFSKGRFIYLAGLVLLAAWRKSLPPGVQVSVDDHMCNATAKRFLTNTGFREIIETGHETPSMQKKDRSCPFAADYQSVP